MRKFVVAPLLLAPLLLAGCGSQSSAGNASASASASTTGSAAPAPAATAVTGSVALGSPAEIEATAALTLSLVDVTKQPGVTINTQAVNAPKFPLDFHIPFSASAINTGDLYVLQATMRNGERTWTTRLQQPVLTHGQPAHVSLTLLPEPTPAEKMLDTFKQAKRQTGGMTVKSGTASKIGESRSWQVFSDIHGVEFIIEQVNRADNGFSKTDYAYRDGLPWVVVQEEMPKPDAPATSTARVGWDSQGVLVLKQLEKGGKTTTVSAAAAKALHRQAENEYGKFAKPKH